MFAFQLQEDLLSLKVSNELHHLSIKRGIQVLRLHNFNPGCLKRRPSTDEVGSTEQRNKKMSQQNKCQ